MENEMKEKNGAELNQYDENQYDKISELNQEELVEGIKSAEEYIEYLSKIESVNVYIDGLLPSNRTTLLCAIQDDNAIERTKLQIEKMKSQLKQKGEKEMEKQQQTLTIPLEFRDTIEGIPEQVIFLNGRGEEIGRYKIKVNQETSKVVELVFNKPKDPLRMVPESITFSEVARIMGRKGGQAKTKAKKRSSPINGKKGGRPKKIKKEDWQKS